MLDILFLTNVYYKLTCVVSDEMDRDYSTQEAMENFVFPDEVKTKLMRMSKLVTFFTCCKIM